MKIWGLTESKVAEIVSAVSAENYHGNVIPNRLDGHVGPRVTTTNLTLRCKNGRGTDHYTSGRRQSPSGFSNGRWTMAACWHAHRDVIRALFANGATRVQSALADYRDRDDFEAKYPATADHNVGSIMYPAYMPDLCECEG